MVAVWLMLNMEPRSKLNAPLCSPTIRLRRNEMIELGSRLELFVDDFLVEEMKGVSFKLQNPIEREIVFTFDKPWEGSTCAYVSIFKDGDTYRMYYRGSDASRRRESCICYAESPDGIRWHRPELGLFEFEGSAKNNIVLTDSSISANFSVFKDPNPDAPDSERYKMLGGSPLRALASPDGIQWRFMREEPVITHGAFDSQNLAFYDPLRRRYMAYYRGFKDGYRSILHATSTDFLDWNDDEELWIELGDAPAEHLYTNATTPYFRAPHIYISLPKRFVPERKVVEEFFSDGVSDAVFMTSRDGIRFDRRFMEAFIRPGRDRARWICRNNMPAWGILPTTSELGDEEISIYWLEHYYIPGCRLRRGTLRLDGFVSVNAPYCGGELLTRPFTFSGSRLLINYSTSAVGFIRVEIQDHIGKPFNGYSLEDCPEIYGDEIERAVRWNDGEDLSKLQDKPIRLRFLLKDADLFSLRFRD